ncbi:MAG: MBL fold metallo-hydrolase [Chloroflexi bacterium]|nr:MBL fold metallo-hydrolase [Chloroflexota bacterium]
MDSITFLGTGGARVMVAQQIVASGGLWMNLGGTEILFDPGPGCIVQATKRRLNPRKLAAIYLSHKHLDHSGDINVMIEAMTEGGLRKRGLVLAPRDALEEDPVILRYLRSYPEDIVILEEGKTYRVGDVTLETPLRHQHSVETYGAIFSTAEHTFSCIVDTRYFEPLVRAYRGDLAIMNVVRLEPSAYDHLSIPDARRLITALRPRVAVLTHFGMTVWRARPWELAKQLSEETGVRVIAARDGMTLDLAEP